MNLRAQLALIRDELDSRQIPVEFEITTVGVEVKAKDYGNLLIAQSALRKVGIEVAE